MMINSLIERIEDELERESRILPLVTIYQITYEVLYLKYLCDEKILKFDEIMQMDDLSELKMNDEYLTFTSEIDYKKLLHDIIYENLSEMIKEFVSNKDVYDHINLSNKRQLIYNDYGYMTDLYYDLNGNSTFIVKNNRDDSKYILFKLFDKVLKLNNDYKTIDEINIEEYGDLHYYGMWGKLGPGIERTYEEIFNYVKKGLRVIFYTNYHRINNYRNGRITLRSLKDVVFLPNDKAIMIYQKKDNEDISIINYNEENDLEKLKKIIIDDKEIKNVLIKIKMKDVIKNKYRLGFRLYQLEYVEKNKTINEIVDHNTHLINRLESINEVVEKEVNFLINK